MRDDQFANLVRLGNIHVHSSEMFLGGDYIQLDRLPFTGARGDDLRDYRDRPELRRSEQEDLQRLSHFRLSFTQQVRLPWAFLNAYFNNSFFLDRDAARYSRLTWTGNWSSPSTPLWCSSPPAWTASCSPPPCPWTWTPSYPSTRSISIWTTEQH